MAPLISLVICTRNRAMQLRRCLQALMQQTIAPRVWELVVVDNGSSDDTHVAVADCEGHLALRFVSEPRVGQTRARNTGVRASSAPLVAFTDDDCYAAPDYLSRLIESFASPAVDYVGGRILLHDETDAAETLQTRPYRLEFSPGLIMHPGDIHGANMACRREVWERIGGFDERLGPGTRFVCDDVDFLCRASLAGFEGLYDPLPTVWHHHGRKPGPDVDRLHTVYARGRGAYYLKGCLHSQDRRKFAKRWYWHLQTQQRRGRYREIAHELMAAAEFAVRGWS